MLALVVKALFVIISLIACSMFVYGKLFVFKKKHPSFVSAYCATMAIFVAIYSILALALVWLMPSSNSKLIMFGFAISPFLIGLLATYHTEKYYTIVQILVFLTSILYVVL